MLVGNLDKKSIPQISVLISTMQAPGHQRNEQANSAGKPSASCSGSHYI
jgi:hypothetical protein